MLYSAAALTSVVWLMVVMASWKKHHVMLANRAGMQLQQQQEQYHAWPHEQTFPITPGQYWRDNLPG
jgi:hypothetical protein